MYISSRQNCWWPEKEKRKKNT